jgi:hypothetical protein
MRMKIALLPLLLAALLIPIIASVAHAQSGASIDVSLVSQNPDPARSGETVELRFIIENTGSQGVTDLEFELMPQYPFMEIPGEEYVKTVKSMQPYQQGADAVTVKYTVRVDKDAVKGTNQIKLKRSEKGSDISVIETFDVDVTGAEYAQIIYVDRSIVSPGEETPLKFTITNVGTSPLKNLVFSWNEENGAILPVYSDDTKYIKYIDVGESVDMEYTVVADVNADPGLYQLDLKLTYESDEGVSEEINTKAGIFIGGGTDFDVTFSESSAGQTSLSVANTGNNPALSVTVRIPDQDNFRVSGSTSSIIGNLDRGDYTIVSFQITQSAGVGTRTGMENIGQMSEEERQNLMEQYSQRNVSDAGNNLEVLIEYTDTTGKRHTLEKSVPIQFRSDNSTISQTMRFGTRANTWTAYLPYIILVVVVAAGIICYRKRKFLRKRLSRHVDKRKV